MDNAAVNIHIQVFMGTYTFICLAFLPCFHHPTKPRFPLESHVVPGNRLFFPYSGIECVTLVKPIGVFYSPGMMTGSWTGM